MNFLSNCLILSLAILSLGCSGTPTEDKGKKVADGLVERYYPDGTLKSAIVYKKSKRNGEAKSYYKNGKLRQVITYVNDVKHGQALTYYENGRLFQETPYQNGKVEGVRKKYRTNGKLMAEIPYSANQPCAGLKEYLLSGEEKTEYPKIEIVQQDEMLKSSRYLLILQASDGSRNADFFLGKLTDGGCIPHDALAIRGDKKGQAKLTYNMPPNSFLMKELNFIARIKTRLGNTYITETSHYLAIENK